MNNQAREKGRAAIYTMAGVYLLYLAYSIFQSRAESSGGEFAVIMAAMVAFVIFGVGLIVWGLRMMNRIHNRPQEELEQEDESSDEQ